MKHDELAASLSQQPTLPLDRLASQTAIAFNAYIDQYRLDPLAISIRSGMRYSTVWNIQHGIAVTNQHAIQVRRGLEHLTGIPYTGPINIKIEEHGRRKV